MLTHLLIALCVSHPNSFSTSLIEVRGDMVRVELVAQALTFIEELGLDADGDLLLDADEFERARPQLEAYVLEKLSVRSAGVALSGRVEGARTVMDPIPAGEEPRMGQWLEFELRFDHRAAVEDLAVGFELFEVMNSAHLDYSTLLFNDEQPQRWVFAMGSRLWEHETWAARRPRVLREFLRRGGAAALADGLTLGLLLMLLCACSVGRSGLGVAGLAVVGFGSGFGFAAAGLGALSSSFLGLAAALSVAYVATDTLLRQAPRRPLLEAVVFAAVHGLCAGDSLSRDVRAEPLTAAALTGLELGAMGVLAAAAALCWLSLGRLPGARDAEGEAAWLAPRAARRLAGSIAGLWGFWLFADRAGFLDWLG